MAFPRNLLADHEEIVFDLKPHWVAIVPSLLWTLALIVLWILGYGVAKSVFDNPSVAQNVVAAIVLIAFVWLALIPFLRWQFTSFVLTTDRLITRSGIIAKHSKEIPLERINDVAFNQTVFERIVGAGDLLIESAGERGQERIENVRKPEEVQLMIFKATENNTLRTASAPTAAEQLEALARLRDQGILTEEEFNVKKKELLDRI